jgi:hypothetical protein
MLRRIKEEKSDGWSIGMAIGDPQSSQHEPEKEELPEMHG